jgi:hypothetical protein
VRTRWRVLACALAVIAAGVSVSGPTRAGASRRDASERRNSPSSLELYYTPPVLVRAGERVTLPVDVICATSRGLPCSADLILGLDEPGRGWRTVQAGSVRRAQFDLSAPAARAEAIGGSVSFYLRARSGKRSVSLPPGGAASPLRFHVTRHMPIVDLPAIRYGDVRRPTTVLFLPWGSGPMRAGLSFGHEAPTSGPPAFDVGDRGRIYVLDPAQERLAVFDRRRLARTARIDLHPSALVAAAAVGANVLDRADGSVRSRTVDSLGRVATAVDLGRGIPSDVRAFGDEVFAHVLPLDAWVRVTPRGPSGILTGRPFHHGAQLLRIGSERSLRLGMLSGGRVRAAVEVRSTERFGEVALAEPDGRNGYIVVVRVWRQRPSITDQFQVVHLGGSGRLIETFAVSSAAIADTPPMGRFRLGPDGDLYQLVTGRDGTRIVRFDLEGGGR